MVRIGIQTTVALAPGTTGSVSGPRGISLFALAICSCSAVAEAEEFRISFPVDCIIGKSCFIQNYVDVDAGPGVKDYRCGRQTYNGHKGTDFRLLSTRETEKNVAVLAAAPGVVKATRDGMQDSLLGKDHSAVKGRECGNGVIVDHGEGRETQYCHMLQGSIAVRKGERVGRGARLGAIGYSGKTQFAHLHFSLRVHGKVVDPFTGRNPDAVCNSVQTAGYWQPQIAKSLVYQPGELLQAGFAGRAVKALDFEMGTDFSGTLSKDSAAIVLFARFINLQKDDRVALILTGPQGPVARSESKPLSSSKAQYVVYSGRKRRGQSWPLGRYRGTVTLIREGTAVMERDVEIHMR